MKKVTLYLHPNQIGGKSIKGTELLKHFEDNDMLKDMMTIEELEKYVQDNSKETEEWKDKRIFAWKSTFRNSGGDLCVRCLYWVGGKWSWRCHWLGYHWDSQSPAACLASSTQNSETMTLEKAVAFIKELGWTITLTK